MYDRLKLHVFLIAGGIGFLLIVLWGAGRLLANSVAEPPPLFSPAVLPRSMAGREMAANVARERFVTVNPTALLNNRATGLQFTLFDDAQFTATHQRTDHYVDGGFVWVGRLPDTPSSEVSFSMSAGHLAGTVNIGRTLYKIHPVADGVHVIQQMSGQPRPDAEPLVPPLPPDLRTGADAQSSTSDDGSIIDVLVVYTPAAKAAASSGSSINALINLAVSESNTGRANSQVNHQLRLIHQTEINYTESGDITTDLIRLASTSDGHMDAVHSIRNTYAADVVVLIIDGNSSSYCGLAYLMQTLTTGFAPNAFSVVAHDCATGYYSFGHEIGHNMGSTHDRNNAGSQGLYSYSYGYQDPEADFRTIMAYNCPGGCPRVNHWSNPNVAYSVYGPTGISASSPNSADNRLSVNNAAFTVANFRQSSSVATPTPTASPSPTPTNTPTPTSTPSPTNTPTPSPTPTSTPLPVITQTWSGTVPLNLNTADTALNLPAGLVNGQVNLVYRAIGPTSLPATPIPPLISTHYQYELLATYSSNGQPAQPQPGTSYQVTINYTTEGRRLAKEGSLALFFWNQNLGQWQQAAITMSVDANNDRISGSLDRFGTWAVFGEGPDQVFIPLTRR